MRARNIAFLTLFWSAVGIGCSGCSKNAGLTVLLTPRAATVTPGGAIAFSAAVDGAASGQSDLVTWSVQEAAGGTVDASGKYVAPAADGRAAFERTASVLLLDGRGRERVVYGLEQLTPESLAHDIRRLQAG